MKKKKKKSNDYENFRKELLIDKLKLMLYELKELLRKVRDKND